MAEFKKIAEVSDLSSGRKEITIEEKKILLLNLNEKIYAIGSRCPHRGLSLVQGKIEGNIITCPYHGSRFDVTTGQVVKGPAKEGLPIYEIKVEGKDILISI
ncbi:MAG: glycine betaine catabolism [Candidatus Atribacteria bacterium]|jgi:nitrite reductase/ring-hydroxylating ferredoxin subunit|nr:glycine betaine catabolism [Candidatus Atribacteria bacterium]